MDHTFKTSGWIYMTVEFTWAVLNIIQLYLYGQHPLRRAEFQRFSLIFHATLNATEKEGKLLLLSKQKLTDVADLQKTS